MNKYSVHERTQCETWLNWCFWFLVTSPYSHTGAFAVNMSPWQGPHEGIPQCTGRAEQRGGRTLGGSHVWTAESVCAGWEVEWGKQDEVHKEPMRRTCLRLWLRSNECVRCAASAPYTQLHVHTVIPSLLSIAGLVLVLLWGGGGGEKKEFCSASLIPSCVCDGLWYFSLFVLFTHSLSFS